MVPILQTIFKKGYNLNLDKFLNKSVFQNLVMLKLNLHYQVG